MEDVFKVGAIIVATIILIMFHSIAMAFPIKWCWNYVVVFIWDLPAITWGHAWCLSFLASAFFKSTSFKSST